MSIIWAIILAIFLVFLGVSGLPRAVWNFYRRWKAVRSIPGWPTHWFWGNLHQVKADEETLFKWTRFVQENRAKVTKFWVGPVAVSVNITHCEAVQKVLKLPKDRSMYSFLLPWLGDGLLIAENPKWFRNRRLLTPAFHYEILKGYVPVVNSCLEVFFKKWSMSAESGTTVRTFKDVSKLSLDIMMRCAFTHNSGCQESEDNLYVNTVYELIKLISKRMLNLFHRIDFIYSHSKNGKRFKQLCKTAHDYTESLIRERKQALGIGGAGEKEESESILKRASQQRKYLDFLDILLTAQDEEGRGLTDLEIRDEADTFLFEGHDTTTSGMAWTLYCLAKHPEHQDKIREEVGNVLMGREWLEYEDLKDLNYTTWCIKEAMRLYPPVATIMRVADQDIEIAGHMIPEGTRLPIRILSIHRHPDTWENPDEYNPLRFHPTAAEGRHPYAYIPFSAGYRNCIGQNFALIEEKMVVASIIHRFQLSLVEDHKVEVEPGVVLRAKNDIKLRLKVCEVTMGELVSFF